MLRVTYSQVLFFVYGEEKLGRYKISTVVCNPTWELSVEMRWGQMCSIFLRTTKHVHCSLLLQGIENLLHCL